MLADTEKSAAEVDAATNTLLGVCVPLEVEHGQIIDVFVKYLNATPNQRHLPARSLLYSAMLEAFPCS